MLKNTDQLLALILVIGCLVLIEHSKMKTP